MKQLLTTLISFLLIGCSGYDSQPVDNNHRDVALISQDTLSLDGLWVMADYVDSILTYKTISKYRLQWPTWFAILIDIEDDTLRTYGSILDIETPYDSVGDTIHVFENTVTGQWTLTLNQQTQKLELRNTDSIREEIDPKTYVFEQRSSLRFLLDTLDQVHQTRTSFTNYFIDKLFVGTYDIIGTDEQVTFDSKGQIIGFQDFQKYDLDIYYGTLHPYNNLDNITFYRDLPAGSKEFDWELFKWEFKGDTLILTQFTWELYNHQGRIVRDEIWKLSNEVIKLKRKIQH